MAKLDSLQKQIIESVKRNVKKDLGYDPQSKTFMDSKKYGTSFELHALEWLQAELKKYERHVNENDSIILHVELEKWIDKIKRTCIIWGL